ncbi:MAG: hypothetical protein JXQ27_18600 [Acidobacteria bacterium]|nr:hypothetical protein [Acidobacteriota bacterium]
MLMILLVVPFFAGMMTAGAPVQVDITVRQSGEDRPRRGGVIPLARGEFDLVFTLDGPAEFLVNASFLPKACEAAGSGRPLGEIPGYTGAPFEEPTFNQFRSLPMDDAVPLLWYYRDETDYHFNDIEEQDGRLVCMRTVSSVRFLNDPDRFIPLEEITEDGLFLVLIQVRHGADGVLAEQGRTCLHLVFE